MKTYYKVVSQDLKSASYEAFKLELEVQYSLNKWIYPKCNSAPLMVFRLLDDAKSYVRRFNTNSLIYACHIKKSNKRISYCHNKNNFETMIRIKNKKKKLPNFGMDFPTGTIFADAVCLIEKVR